MAMLENRKHGWRFNRITLFASLHDTKTQYGEMVAEKFGITEMEITDEVFRSKYGRQFEEAENRMHSIKAIMAATLGNLFIPRRKQLKTLKKNSCFAL